MFCGRHLFSAHNGNTNRPAKYVWIATDDQAMALGRDAAIEYPYLDVPGRQRPVSIRQGRIDDLPLPDGGPVEAEDHLG